MNRPRDGRLFGVREEGRIQIVIRLNGINLFIREVTRSTERDIVRRSVPAPVQRRSLENEQRLRPGIKDIGDLGAAKRKQKPEKRLKHFRARRRNPDGVGHTPEHLPARIKYNGGLGAGLFV